jgi:hypothetical protein
MQIGVQNRSGLDPIALAFQVRAINLQMVRDFIPAWAAERWAAVGLDFRLPGGDVPWIVNLYDDLTRLPAGTFWPLSVVDETPPGELGDHTNDAGLVSGRWQPNPVDENDATVGSHEALEMRGDPGCNAWIPGATSMLAAEAADVVERDWYAIDVDLFGERRSIRVSNFILPAWFVPGAPPPYDMVGLCRRPLEVRPGGYVIEMRDGKVTTDGADVAHKLADPRSRTARRHAAGGSLG